MGGAGGGGGAGEGQGQVGGAGGRGRWEGQVVGEGQVGGAGGRVVANLSQHGCCKDFISVLGRDQISYSQEYGRSVLKRGSLPLSLCCQGHINGLLNQVLQGGNTRL